MSEKYKIHDAQQLYFVSFATVNWIDVFTRRLHNNVFVDSLRYCRQHKGLELYAWCLMTNHAHLIISSESENLSGILRDLKRHTAKTLLRAIEQNLQESRREWMLWMFERAGPQCSQHEVPVLAAGKPPHRTQHQRPSPAATALPAPKPRGGRICGHAGRFPLQQRPQLRRPPRPPGLVEVLFIS